jgi:hypothetical protein
MSEHFPQPSPEVTQEKGSEQLPSKEQVMAVFEKLLDGRESSEMVSRTDRYGHTVYEVTTTDERGITFEYNFQQALYAIDGANVPSSGRFSASIHLTVYDGGMPVSGHCVANYRDGEWSFIPE